MTYGTLRSCGVGGGHHAAFSSSDFNGTYFCPKHLHELMKDFEEELLRPGWDRSRVRFIGTNSYPGDYVALSRDGDMVTVRKLGAPESPTMIVSIGQLYPGWYPTFSQGCGPRPKPEAQRS